MVQFGQFFHAGYSMFKELKFGGQWFSLVNSDAMFWVSRSEFSLIPITTIHVMILGRALEWNVYSAGASVYDCLNLVFRRRNEKPWQKRWRWANRKADERDWWIPWSFLSQTNHPPNLPGYFLMWPVLGFGNPIRVREGAKIHFRTFRSACIPRGDIENAFVQIVSYKPGHTDWWKKCEIDQRQDMTLPETQKSATKTGTPQEMVHNECVL